MATTKTASKPAAKTAKPAAKAAKTTKAKAETPAKKGTSGISVRPPVKAAPAKKTAAKKVTETKPAAKAPARKAAPKAETPKKVPVKKAAPKAETPEKTPAKKVAPKAETAKKVVPKAEPPKKTPAKKTAPKAETPKKAPVKKASAKKAAPAPEPTSERVRPGLQPKYQLVRPTGKKQATARSRVFKEGQQHFSDEDLAEFRRRLLADREAILSQLRSTRADALRRSDEDNLEEDGSNTFSRSADLSRADEQHTRLHAIDDALRAIEKKTYGICQVCHCLIPRDRLRAAPFAIRCVNCKAEYEKNVAAAKRSQNI